jgi:hypothetical protein
MALQPFFGPWPLFNFLILYTVGRTPWTGDQPISRPVPVHRINADIHALSGIRIHDPSVRASEDGSYLTPRGHRDRPKLFYRIKFQNASSDGTGISADSEVRVVALFVLMIVCNYEAQEQGDLRGIVM